MDVIGLTRRAGAAGHHSVKPVVLFSACRSVIDACCAGYKVKSALIAVIIRSLIPGIGIAAPIASGRVRTHDGQAAAGMEGRGNGIAAESRNRSDH